MTLFNRLFTINWGIFAPCQSCGMSRYCNRQTPSDLLLCEACQKKQPIHPLNRQSTFRDDGTVTDVPTELTDTPQEEQVELGLWAEDKQRLEDWNRR